MSDEPKPRRRLASADHPKIEELRVSHPWHVETRWKEWGEEKMRPTMSDIDADFPGNASWVEYHDTRTFGFETEAQAKRFEEWGGGWAFEHTHYEPVVVDETVEQEQVPPATEDPNEGLERIP